MTVHDDVVNEVEGDVQADEEQLERCKLQWTLFVSEVSERNALESIDCHGYEHRPYVGWMFRIAHRIAQWRDEEEHQGNEEQGGGTHHAEHCVINLFGVFALFVDEAEEGGLHSVGQDDEEQRCVSVHVGDDTITTTGGTNLCRVEWHKQIVEESADDTAHTIDGGILCE